MISKITPPSGRLCLFYKPMVMFLCLHNTRVYPISHTVLLRTTLLHFGELLSHKLLLSLPRVTPDYRMTTVEPPNNGHIGDEHFVHCSEVVPSLEVVMGQSVPIVRRLSTLQRVHYWKFHCNSTTGGGGGGGGGGGRGENYHIRCRSRRERWS